MPTKIGIISDIHATEAPVREAFAAFKKRDVEQILCAGDIAGYGDELEETIDLLTEFNCKSIKGNHEVWYLEKEENSHLSTVDNYLNDLPLNIEMKIEGKDLFMVHASPPDSYTGGIRLLDEDGELLEEQLNEWKKNLLDQTCDILIIGHTHQVFAEIINKTLVINPGSSKFNHSCAVLTLPEMSIEWIALSGKPISKVWNWGAYMSKIKEENNRA